MALAFLSSLHTFKLIIERIDRVVRFGTRWSFVRMKECPPSHGNKVGLPCCYIVGLTASTISRDVPIGCRPIEQRRFCSNNFKDIVSLLINFTNTAIAPNNDNWKSIAFYEGYKNVPIGLCRSKFETLILVQGV